MPLDAWQARKKLEARQMRQAVRCGTCLAYAYPDEGDGFTEGQTCVDCVKGRYGPPTCACFEGHPYTFGGLDDCGCSCGHVRIEAKPGCTGFNDCPFNSCPGPHKRRFTTEADKGET